jgi:hypothetical protein
MAVEKYLPCNNRVDPLTRLGSRANESRFLEAGGVLYSIGLHPKRPGISGLCEGHLKM